MASQSKFLGAELPHSKPTMYLHVGTHKTGTTSIQSALTNSRPALAKAGLFYPDFSRFSSGSQEAHHCLAHDLSVESRASDKLVSECVSEIRSVIEAGGIPIVSSEAFNRHRYPENQPEKMSSRRAAREAYVTRLTSLFPDVDIKIILYLRHPVELAESLFSTRITNSKSRKDFDQLVRKNTFVFDYNYQIEQYEKHFASLKVVHFDDAKRDGIVRTFFGIVGADPDSARELHVRPTPSRRALTWMLYKRNSGTGNQEARTMAHFANAVEASGLFDSVRPLAFWSNREQLQEFQDRYCSAPIAGREYPYLERENFRSSIEDDDFSVIDQAYLDWCHENSRELAFRKSRKMPHFTPMRLDKSEIIRERQTQDLRAAICVVTRDQPTSLRATLDSLGEASRPANTDCTVVVVENGASEISREETESFSQRSGIKTIYCREENASQPAACNRAIQEALATGADVILFLGGTATASPDWMAHFVSRYRNTDLQLVGGPVRLARSANRENLMTRLLKSGLAWSFRSEAMAARRQFALQKNGFVPINTNNWIGSREVFDWQGMRFRDADDHIANFFDDSMILDVRCGWNPQAVVFEEPQSTQVTFRHIFERGRDLQQTSVRYGIRSVGKHSTLMRHLPRLLFKSVVLALGPIAVVLTAGLLLPAYVHNTGETVGLATALFGARPSPNHEVKEAEA